MKTYYPTIGLEIHAELKTKTKMFCDSKNDPDETVPNVNVCPVCVGHPGTLPTINKQAVKHVLKFGVAVGGKLANFCEFDRKNYFYPDIPKGYQISQYKYPLVSGGELAGIKLTRVHLEEDTGTSIHDRGDHTLLDFNRAGLPLMELVTEPVMHSAKEAGDFARELRLLLRVLDVAEANMEKGEMRVEANISVKCDARSEKTENEEKEEELGTKVEVKNLNSFRAVERAVEYEIKRQTEVLEKGEKVTQETRGWDENKGVTFSQRSKEEARDYRYFPEPDLPKLFINEIPEFGEDNLRKELPELPWQKRQRYKDDFGLNDEQTEFFVTNESFAEFFENTAKELNDVQKVKIAANYIISDIAGLVKATSKPSGLPFSPLQFSLLVSMIFSAEISSRGAKDILAIMYKEGGDPRAIAKEKNLIQQSDESSVSKMAEEIISENPKVVSEYKAGKEASMQFLIGQGMKKSKGSINPEMLKKILVEILKK
ncbi:MAG: Asp-tRNA(Asn)/Glu-tRNA(Gln) amidotransferase subunit GatB [bacterium]|nr:Asp-tRNA(Asn)/Glu-tRNA(Gln) amidotransferase subunit GatB [bacterium]